MVLFIGLFYLLLVVPGLFQHHTSRAQIFGWKEIKFILLGFFYLASGVLFFRRRPVGWILSFSGLLNVAIIALVFVVNISQSGRLDGIAAISIAFFVLVTMCCMYMLNRETRKAYQVSNKSYLLTIVLYGLLLTVTYVL